MKRYEYKTEIIIKDFTDILNQYGLDGWQVIYIKSADNPYGVIEVWTVIFMRELQN